MPMGPMRVATLNCSNCVLPYKLCDYEKDRFTFRLAGIDGLRAAGVGVYGGQFRH